MLEGIMSDDHIPLFGAATTVLTAGLGVAFLVAVFVGKGASYRLGSYGTPSPSSSKHTSSVRAVCPAQHRHLYSVLGKSALSVSVWLAAVW